MLLGEHIPMKDHLSAIGALRPKILGRIAFGEQRLKLGPRKIRQPVHM
jgi:hypothetical protein